MITILEPGELLVPNVRAATRICVHRSDLQRDRDLVHGDPGPGEALVVAGPGDVYVRDFHFLGGLAPCEDLPWQ